MVMMEPSSELRVLAGQYRQFFNALVGAGFTEPQAMDILTTMIMVQE